MSGLFVFVEILKISVGQRATDKWFKYVNYLGGGGGWNDANNKTTSFLM